MCLGAIDGIDLDPARFHVQPLGTFELAAFVRAGHPLAFKGALRTADLQERPWVFYSGDFERTREINRRLQAEGLPPIAVNFEVNSIMMGFNIGATTHAIVCAAAVFAEEPWRYPLVQLPITLGSFASAGWIRKDRPRLFAADKILEYVMASLGQVG
jgi:DNA-binding transcriptional LysR family regulator